jgi:hypothetical protein
MLAQRVEEMEMFEEEEYERLLGKIAQGILV